jgi:hypothetical protein
VPARLTVSERHDRALIRQVADPFLPRSVRVRPGKAPFIPDYFVRLESAVPELAGRLSEFENSPLWNSICDARKPGVLLAQFNGQTNNEADYSNIIQQVMLPYYLGRFLALKGH